MSRKRIRVRPPLKVGKKYSCGGEILGKGGFVTNNITKERCALKIESKYAKFPQLLREAKIIKSVGKSCRYYGIPKVYSTGSENKYNYVVMQFLGPSLDDLISFCGGKFSLKTTLMLAIQLIKQIRIIHNSNFVHRDLKPGNFLMGRGRKSHIVHIIDYGLSKRFCNSHKVHIQYIDNYSSITGTARYASLNNHMGIEQSRRDDMESLAYVFIFFMTGRLPWQGLKKGRTIRDKYNNIHEKKTIITTKELCKNLPSAFLTFLNYVRSMGFEDKPDYSFLRRNFQVLLKKSGHKMDYLYDWWFQKDGKVRYGDLLKRVGKYKNAWYYHPPSLYVPPHVKDKEKSPTHPLMQEGMSVKKLYGSGNLKTQKGSHGISTKNKRRSIIDSDNDSLSLSLKKRRRELEIERKKRKERGRKERKERERKERIERERRGIRREREKERKERERRIRKEREKREKEKRERERRRREKSKSVNMLSESRLERNRRRAKEILRKRRLKY